MGHGKSCYALTRVVRKLLLSFTLISCLNFLHRAKLMLGFGGAPSMGAIFRVKVPNRPAGGNG